MAHEDWLNHEDGWRVDGDASTEMFVDVCWFSVTHPTHDDIPSKKVTCLKTNIAKDWGNTWLGEYLVGGCDAKFKQTCRLPSIAHLVFSFPKKHFWRIIVPDAKKKQRLSETNHVKVVI